MTDWRAAAQDTARTLQRNALAGGIVTLVVLLAGGAGCAAPLPQLLILASALAALASAAYVLFDAALFRLALSHPRQDEGLAAIDDTLDRMGLRRRPEATRPLGPRIAGSRRILHVHRIALATFLVLFAVHFFDGAARC